MDAARWDATEHEVRPVHSQWRAFLPAHVALITGWSSADVSEMCQERFAPPAVPSANPKRVGHGCRMAGCLSSALKTMIEEWLVGR
jgi:hypothetical protein